MLCRGSSYEVGHNGTRDLLDDGLGVSNCCSGTGCNRCHSLIQIAEYCWVQLLDDIPGGPKPPPKASQAASPS